MPTTSIFSNVIYDTKLDASSLAPDTSFNNQPTDSFAAFPITSDFGIQMPVPPGLHYVNTLGLDRSFATPSDCV